MCILRMGANFAILAPEKRILFVRAVITKKPSTTNVTIATFKNDLHRLEALMRGTVAKKLRQIARRRDRALSEKAFKEFKAWIGSLPLRNRIVVAFKVLARKI